MTATEVLHELQALGSERYKRMMMKNHGVREPCFGVKIGDMKAIQKRIKTDYQLALDLYDTGNYDAMYLAGLVADDARMTKRDLQAWVRKADQGALSGATVPWTAAGSRHGFELAQKWIASPKPHIAAAGWATLSGLAALTADADLDLAAFKDLLTTAEKAIDRAPDEARYQINDFIIALGRHVAPLFDAALRTGEKIGPVEANLGGNTCQIPFAPDKIRQCQARGAVGKKRKTVKC